MRDRLILRLEALKEEFERGRTRLEEIAAEEERLRTAMLRISGAIQVLSEEVDGEETPDADAADADGDGGVVLHPSNWTDAA